MSTYVNDLRLEEIGTGEASGTWGTKSNVSLQLIGEALGYGTEAITTNADTHTSTIADGATDPVRAMFVKYTGTLDSACTITIAPNTICRMQFIENATSGSQNIIISQGSGANITIPAGDTKAVYLDGAGSGAAVVDAFASLSTVDLKVQDDLTVTGDIDVDGTANLDVVDIDGAVDMASTLGVTGVVTANAGVVVDNITIDGTEIDLSSGDLTLDVAGDIIFDADGDDFFFAAAGTNIGKITNSSSDFLIRSLVQDKDIIFKGDDAGSTITALTLDMSEAGAATFNDSVTADTLIGGASNFDIRQNTSDGSDNQRTRIGGGGDVSQSRGAFIELAGNEHTNTGDIILNAGDVSGGDIVFKTDNTTRVTIDDAGGMEITTADNADTLSLVSTDADANSGPNLRMYRNSGSPADSDAIALIDFEGRNDNSQDVVYAAIDTRIVDASDGTEDGRIEMATILAGTPGTSRILMDATETAFNDNSKDLDFRVESDNLTHALFVQGSDGLVGVGTTGPGAALHVDHDSSTAYNGSAEILESAIIRNKNGSDGSGVNNVTTLGFHVADGATSQGFINYKRTGDNTGQFSFSQRTGSSTYAEAMTILNDGKVGIGTNDPAKPLNVKISADGSLVRLGRSGVCDWDISIGNTSTLSGVGSGALEFLPQNSGTPNEFAIGKAGTTASLFHATIDGVTMSQQPAFQVRPASTQTNIATGSEITVVFGTEVFDIGANFASNTFTAPVTGKYQLNLSLYTNAIDTASGYYIVAIKTSNRQYDNVLDPGVLASDPVYWNQGLSVLADMDANDTAYVFIQQESGTAQTDVATGSVFSGFLAC
jgi:hypothetical protein